MPLRLDPALTRQYFEDNVEPAPQLDLLHAAAFRIAGAALRLGVFRALADGPVPVKELAARLGVSERGLDHLLPPLVSFGYLAETPDGYVNTRWGEWLLDKPGSTYATVFSFWQTNVFDIWRDLEQSVRDGEPAVDFYWYLQQHPRTLREFQVLLAGIGDSLLPEILEQVPMPDPATRLLDVGGGHGVYSIEFCRRYPQLTATVLELAETVAVGKEYVTDAGLADRITFQVGDLHTTRYDPGSYDVALLFKLVHGLRAEQVRALFRNMAEAVRPGGTVAILEQLGDRTEDNDVASEAFVQLFSLNLFHGQAGRVYQYAELAQWLAAAGFTGIREYGPMRRSPINFLVTAIRQVDK